MADKYTTVDNGTRMEYSTGARKEQPKGKGRYDLLQPSVIKRDADLYERGAEKYGDRNYEKGLPDSRLVSSMLRHAFQYLEGKTDEDHLAAVRWNAAAIMFNEEMIKQGKLPEELHDLPWQKKVSVPSKDIDMSQIRYLQLENVYEDFVSRVIFNGVMRKQDYDDLENFFLIYEHEIRKVSLHDQYGNVHERVSFRDLKQYISIKD